MNSQTHTDARIDHVLTALRTTEPPAGLEQRIAAHLAQASASRTQSALALPKPSYSLFAGAKFYAAASCAIVLALTTFTVLHNRITTTTQSPSIAYHSTTPTRTASSTQTASATQPQPTRSTIPTTRSVRTSAPTALPPSAQDPDQLALAETLAPSRPAPPMPLTVQEKTLVAATRPGQPIQRAELDLARAPILRAEAEARRNREIERYVKGLLAPFALADALQSTKFSEPREISTAAPAPQIPTSSTN